MALDTLLVDDISVEQATARAHGWEIVRWDGARPSLAAADAVVHVKTVLDSELISLLGRCRVIARFGTGLDTVDREAADRAGIAVVAVNGYCTPELTAHTLALSLTLLRVKAPARPEAHGVQPGWSEFRRLYPLVGDVTAHVVGYGAIGMSVANALRSVHMRVLVTSRHMWADAEGAGFECVTLEQGLSRSDLVLFHLDLSEETRSTFSASCLPIIKPGAIIVNTARLALTEERALVEGLQTGVLGGLGLDCRIPEAHPLWGVVGREDVIITPHIGWYSERSLDVLRRLGVANAITAYMAWPPGTDGPHAQQEVLK